MKVDTLEKNKMRLTFEVSPERFEEGLKFSYNKNKSSMSLPGFRKGKAPRQLFEAQFGKEIFYEDAIEFVLPGAYKNARDESGLDVVAQPQLNDYSVQPDKSVIFTVDVFVKPKVKLGEYIGLSYSKFNTEPTEAEIMAEIEDALEKNSREISVIDRSAADGDIVMIDFVGYVDGEPFENGAGKDYQLVLGSHTFIDGFEDQIIGHTVGEEFQVNVRFPDEYHSEEMAGKDAMFEVTLHEIKTKEKPELDDEFASDVSEFETLEEYKNSIADKLRRVKIARADEEKESQLVQKLAENSEMDLPDVMIEDRMEELLHNFERTVTDRGIDFNKYLEYINQTHDSLLESYRETATAHVKSRLVLEAVAKAEDITVGDEEVEENSKDIVEFINKSDMRDKAEILEVEKKAIAADLRIKKAVEFIIKNAVLEITEEKEVLHGEVE